MKILMLTTHLNTGGISSYLLTLSRALIAEGHQVHIISSGGNMTMRFSASGVYVKDIDLKTKSELSPKIYSALNDVAKYIRDNHIQVIHAHTRVTQVLAQLLKWFYGKKYVTTCHGFFKPRFFRRMFPCWGEAVIAISKQVQSHLHQDFGVPLAKIYVVESGIALEDFPLVEDRIKKENRRQLGIDDAPVIGMVARLSDVKGQDILLRAFVKVLERFPIARLLLVGQGKEEAMLKALAQKLNIKRNVFFHADIDQTAFFLSVFDVFVNPSRQEGLGLSVMEAQACGLPVVASNVGGIPTLVEHAKTGYLVEADHPDKLAQQIIEVLSDLNSARRVGLNGRIFIEKNYSAKRMVDETLKVYEKYSSR